MNHGSTHALDSCSSCRSSRITSACLTRESSEVPCHLFEAFNKCVAKRYTVTQGQEYTLGGYGVSLMNVDIDKDMDRYLEFDHPRLSSDPSTGYAAGHAIMAFRFLDVSARPFSSSLREYCSRHRHSGREYRHGIASRRYAFSVWVVRAVPHPINC